MAKRTEPKWRTLLTEFIGQLRIVSREASGGGTAGVKVNLWGSQRRILDEITAGMERGIRRFYVLKSRQLGSSTAFVIIAIFWHAIHKGMKGAIVFDQDKTREDFREQISFIINSIPAAYFGSAFGIKTHNKYAVTFTNGSQINYLVAGTGGSKVAWGESTGYSFVWLTEIASYGSAEGLSNFEEAMSDTNPIRLYIYESTGKGWNHWRDRCIEAMQDIHRSVFVFVGWWSKELNVIAKSDPLFAQYGLTGPSPREKEKIDLVFERHGHKITDEQLAWIRYRGAKQSQTEQNLLQNQAWVWEDAFQLTGRSFFQSRLIAHDLERMSETIYRGYRFFLGGDFWSAALEQITSQERKGDIELRIWHEPIESAKYSIGCDPAGGSDEKNNNHCIQVFRCYADKFVQVAEYADNMCETHQCAWVLAYLAGVYKNCIINIELGGGYGKAVLLELEHLRQLLSSELHADKRGPRGQDWTDFLGSARYYIYRRPDSPASAGYVTNWQGHTDAKKQLLNELRDAHIDGSLVVNSRPMLEEMLTVVQDGDSIGAPGRQKDDRVIASALAVHSWIQHIRPGMLMGGDTYAKLTAIESGERAGGHIVDNIVAEHFRKVQNQVAEETSYDAWQRKEGLI